MEAKKSKTSLNSEELNYLMKHTNLDGSTVKQWYSGFLRDCPNGKMTQDQFFLMYRMLIPEGNTEKFCKHVFRTFDADNNGYVDFLEFLLALNITSTGNPEEKLKWAFKLYDIDGNGSVSQEEMIKVVQSIYDMLGAGSLESKDKARNRAEFVFQKLDADGDKKLTEEEFIKGCLENEELKSLLTPTMVSDDLPVKS